MFNHYDYNISGYGVSTCSDKAKSFNKIKKQPLGRLIEFKELRMKKRLQRRNASR